jgi:SAM-dependent methyltransferase
MIIILKNAGKYFVRMPASVISLSFSEAERSMWPDIGEFKQFYRDAKGEAVRYVLRRRLRQLWPMTAGQRVLGVGYSPPFLRQFLGEATLLAAGIPGGMGTTIWPVDDLRRVAIFEPEDWPLPDCCMDRILLVHALENCGEPENFLREAWRVLVPGGRLVAIVPHRRSLWSQSEATPFGWGRPFSSRQLHALFTRQLLRPRLIARGLFLPAWWPHPTMRTATQWEKWGANTGFGVGGVLIIEAEKELYGAIPVRASSRRLHFALPSLPLRPA